MAESTIADPTAERDLVTELLLDQELDRRRAELTARHRANPFDPFDDLDPEDRTLVDEIRADDDRALALARDADAAAATRMKSTPFAAFIAKPIPPPRWIVDGLLPASGLGLLAAPFKAGKTLVATQLALCVAAGLPFLARPTGQGAVLIVEEEGTEYDLQSRLKTQAAALGQIWNPALPIHIALRQGLRTGHDAHLAWLRHTIRETNAKLVVVDPLVEVGEVENENDSGEMHRLASALATIGYDLEVLVLLIHHTRKRDPRDGRPHGVSEFMGLVRGSTALTGKTEVNVGLWRSQRQDHAATSDGWLYAGPRSASEFVQPFSLDHDTLLIQPRDETGYLPTAQRTMSNLRIVDEHGPLTVARMGAFLGKTGETGRAALTTLEVAGLVTKSREGKADVFQITAAGAELLEKESAA